PFRHFCDLFFAYCYCAHRDLHSFPTRRSSDLIRRRHPEQTMLGEHLMRRQLLVRLLAWAMLPVFDLDAEAFVPQQRHHIVISCRSEEHTSELQSLTNLVCRLLLEKKKTTTASP